MAEVTMTSAGTVHSSFQPASNTNLPPAAASVPGVKVNVSPPGSDPDKGLKVTQVTIEATDLQTSGSSTGGRFEVYHGGSLLFTADFAAGGGSQSETTAIVVVQGATTNFTVKWYQTESGTYLPGGDKVVLSVSSEDWGT